MQTYLKLVIDKTHHFFAYGFCLNNFSAVKMAFAAILLSLSLTTANSVCAAQGGSMTQNFDLDRRGKQLRVDIENRFKELSSKHELKFQNSINDEVIRWIPIGVSFSDAEVILKGAGFVIDNKDNRTISSSSELPAAWYAKIEVSIYLTSNSDDGIITTELGNITYSTL